MQYGVVNQLVCGIAFNASGHVEDHQTHITAELIIDGDIDDPIALGNPTQFPSKKGRYYWVLDDEIEVTGHALKVNMFSDVVGVQVLLESPIYTTIEAELLSKLDLMRGPGSSSWEIAVKTTTGVAIPLCACWVSTDSSGDTVITDVQYTDSNGIVQFLLDPGTYYLFRQKVGFTFTNPQGFTVS